MEDGVGLLRWARDHLDVGIEQLHVGLFPRLRNDASQCVEPGRERLRSPDEDRNGGLLRQRGDEASRHRGEVGAADEPEILLGPHGPPAEGRSPGLGEILEAEVAEKRPVPGRDAVQDAPADLVVEEETGTAGVRDRGEVQSGSTHLAVEVADHAREPFIRRCGRRDELCDLPFTDKLERAHPRLTVEHRIGPRTPRPVETLGKAADRGYLRRANRASLTLREAE